MADVRIMVVIPQVLLALAFAWLPHYRVSFLCGTASQELKLGQRHPVGSMRAIREERPGLGSGGLFRGSAQFELGG
jgi:hypothetical protein